VIVRRILVGLSIALLPAPASAQATGGVQRVFTLGLFAAVLLISGVITFIASRRTRSVASFYAAEDSIDGVRNGFAIAGDFLSAAAFLGVGGLFTLYGFDAFTYTVGFIVAFVVVLLLIAEPCRNLGRYTIGDILAFRHDRRTAKACSAVSTVTIAICYLIPQLVGGGLLLQLLIGVPFEAAVIIVGVLMLVYVILGGMLATTWIQIVKAALLVSTTVLLVVLALIPFGFNPATLVAAALSDPKLQAQMAHLAGKAGQGLSASQLGDLALEPGWLIHNPWDRLSLFMGLVFGTAALPHVLMRFFTVPDAKSARTSVVWGMGLVGFCNLCFIATGFAAAHFVGAAKVQAADPGGNLAIPLLAQYLGGGADTLRGNLFLAFVAAVACATIVAVVAGGVLSAASAMAHDLYVGALRGSRVSEGEQVLAARVAAFLIGLLAITLSILQRAERRPSRRPGLRGRRVGELRDDHPDPVLEALHDRGPGAGHVDRPGVGHSLRAGLPQHVLSGATPGPSDAGARFGDSVARGGERHHSRRRDHARSEGVGDGQEGASRQGRASGKRRGRASGR
jgi:cation/acetate symporter